MLYNYDILLINLPLQIIKIEIAKRKYNITRAAYAREKAAANVTKLRIDRTIDSVDREENHT